MVFRLHSEDFIEIHEMFHVAWFTTHVDHGNQTKKCEGKNQNPHCPIFGRWPSSGGFWFSNFRWLAVIWWHLDFLDPQNRNLADIPSSSLSKPCEKPWFKWGLILMWEGIRYLWLAFKHRTVFQPVRFDYSRAQLWLNVKTLTKHANHIQ